MPGLSTQLPAPNSPTPAPAIAQVLADGSITLDLGQLPRAKAIDFEDVLRLGSKASKPVSVTLTLSGSVAHYVQRVGFWDDRQGVVSSALTLQPGQTSQVAFEFDLSSKATCGKQTGALTLKVRPADGQPQQWTLPLALTVVQSGSSPSPSCTPSASPSTSPKPKPSHTPKPKPSHTPTGVVTPSPRPTPSPDCSPTPSSSPDAKSGGAIAAVASFLGGLVKSVATAL
jgi:hypothetical protein